MAGRNYFLKQTILPIKIFLIFLIILLFSSNAFSAITYNAHNNTDSVSNSNVLTITFTAATAATDVLMLGSVVNSNTAINSITWVTGSFSQGFSSSPAMQNNGTGIRNEIWYLMAPEAGTGTITVNYAGNVNAIAGVIEYTNVDALVNTGMAAGNVAWLSTNIANKYRNSWIFSIFGQNTSTGTYTWAAPMQARKRWDLNLTGVLHASVSDRTTTTIKSYPETCTSSAVAQSDMVSVEMLFKPTINSSIYYVAPTTLEIGQIITIEISVTNAGGVTADNVLPVTPAAGALTAAGDVSVLSSPAPQTLVYDAAAYFTWTFSAASFGTITFTTAASAIDDYTGLQVSGAKLTSAKITIYAPASLSANIITPSLALLGNNITVVMNVTNVAGGATADNVQPASSPVVSTPSDVSLISTPVVSSVNIAGGATASFTWIYSTLAVDTITFADQASGTDAVSGAVVQTGPITSSPVPIQIATPTSTPNLTATYISNETATEALWTLTATPSITSTVTQTATITPTFTATLAPLIVTSLADTDTSGTLRYCINQANIMSGGVTINFSPSIAGGTINLTSSLPEINGADDQLTIDDGTNNNVINGKGYNIFMISTYGNAVYSLAMIGAYTAVSISGADAYGNTISGCIMGMDWAGNAGANTNGVVISNTANYNYIGITTNAYTNGNIIVNNTTGILVDGSSYNEILGNYIGTDTNFDAFGNAIGILLKNGATYNQIGEGVGSGYENYVMNNSSGGIVVGSSPADSTTLGNYISSNFISGNNGNGIDLGNDGITLNGSETGSGPNNWVYYPTITDAYMSGPTTLHVDGNSNISISDNSDIGIIIGISDDDGNWGSDNMAHGECPQPITFIAISEGTFSVDIDTSWLGGIYNPNLSGQVITGYNIDNSGSSEFSGDVVVLSMPPATLTAVVQATQTAIVLATQTAAVQATQAMAAQQTQTVVMQATQTAVAQETQTAAVQATQTMATIQTQTAIIQATQTAIAVATNTEVAAETGTAIVQAIQTQAAIQTATAIMQATQTAAIMATNTEVAIETATAMLQATQTAEIIATNTEIANETATAVVVGTQTAVAVATNTEVANETATAVAIATQTAAVIATNTEVANETATAVVAGTQTVIAQETATAVGIATQTAVVIATQTAAVQATQTVIVQETATAVVQATQTAVVAATETAVAGFTPVAPASLSVTQNGANTTLQWTTAGDAVSYNIYIATGAAGKLNAFPGAGWTILANVPATAGTTSYTYNDISGNIYTFYMVTGVNASGEGTHSTMGSKVVMSFTYIAGGMNTYRIALPYISKYAKAADIVTDIEGSIATTPTKIDIIALWNPNTQVYNPYGYISPQWLGTNWTVDAGTLSSNAIYMHVISSFNWVVAGTDNMANLYFSYNTVLPSENCRMLPYSGIYTKASQIVTAIEGGTGAGTDLKINIVAIWDPVHQIYTPYGYVGNQWIGTDFTINPGNAVDIYPSGNTPTFNWTPNLAATPVP